MPDKIAEIATNDGGLILLRADGKTLRLIVDTHSGMKSSSLGVEAVQSLHQYLGQWIETATRNATEAQQDNTERAFEPATERAGYPPTLGRTEPCGIISGEVYEFQRHKPASDC